VDSHKISFSEELAGENCSQQSIESKPDQVDIP